MSADETSGSVVERLPWWFIVETMFATLAIGSLLLDLKHQSHRMRRERAEILPEGHRR